MAYFKLSLLSKEYGNIEGYIKNVISEFYGNGEPEELFRYERLNNLTPNYQNFTPKIDTIFTKTYTYNEQIQFHQQGQKQLTFSLDKKIFDDDMWKDNPFASKIKTGSLLLLEDKYSNSILFTVKSIAYKNTEDNIVYSFTCQDSFSFQLSKESDGYTINNDINSENFIGAMSIDDWAKKIDEECKIPYFYLDLATPLYLCSDGTSTTTLARTSDENKGKKILKILKIPYPKTKDNIDLYETLPFSCSGTTANGALIALGEQLGLMLNTATVLEEAETSAFIKIRTYYWFEPSKNTKVSGLKYSPFRDIKDFNFSQDGTSLITMLNIEGRTLSSDEVVTALPAISPFFTILFNSTYWKKYSSYYQGMYKSLLVGPQFTISKDRNLDITIVIDKTAGTIIFTKPLSDELYNLYSLYPQQTHKAGKIESEVIIKDENLDDQALNPSNTDFSVSFIDNNGQYSLQVILNGPSIEHIMNSTVSSIIDFNIHVFFRNEFIDDDKEFADAADTMPWLENKLIDFNYFLTNSLITIKQKKEIDEVLQNKLRKINSDILLNATAYYNQLHIQTKDVAEMTNNIDMMGAEVSNVEKRFLKEGADTYTDNSPLMERWNKIQYNLIGQNKTPFVDLYEKTSDYIRKFLNARQRCLKNLYNFKKYFNQPLDPIYQSYYDVTMSIKDPSGSTNIYSFRNSAAMAEYAKLNDAYIDSHPNYFIKENGVLKDYNNIQLYYDDGKFTPFDKNSRLITKDNLKQLNLHFYVDQWRRQGQFDTYDTETKYYKRVCFISQQALRTAAGLPSADPIRSDQFDMTITLKYKGVEYPTSISPYSQNGQYFVIEKLYEDGRDFVSYDDIILKADSKLGDDEVSKDKSIKDYIISIDSLVDGEYKEDDVAYTFKESDFYQKISGDDILKNFLCRQGVELDARICKPYSTRDFNADFMNGNKWSTQTRRYKPFGTTDYEYQPRLDSDVTEENLAHNQYAGWAYMTDAPTFLAQLRSFTALFRLGLPLFPPSLRTGCLVMGGWANAPWHVGQSDLTGVSPSFSPYRFSKEYWRARYAKNFPLDKIYNGNGDYIELVTKSNYTNFYVKAGTLRENQHYTSAAEGIVCSVDDQNFIIANDYEPYTDFMSDFPHCFFYRTTADNPASEIHVQVNNNDGNTTWSWVGGNTETLQSLLEKGVAFTIGNYIAYWFLFNAEGYNYYRETKQYKKVTTWDSDSKQKYLVVDMTNVTDGLPSSHTELRQYLHYDVIQEGIEVGVEQLNTMDLTNRNVYLIIEGSVDTSVSSDLLTRIGQIWNEKITNENGQLYSLNSFYTKPHIVENLYIREDHKPVSIDGENYDVGQHLYDNVRVLYNDLDERMYTINQIINDLLYKTPGTYTFKIFDLGIPQHIGLYRRKANAAVCEIVDFELHINSSNPSYDATDDNLGLHYRIQWTQHSYGGDIMTTNNLTQGEFWVECTKMTYANTLPVIYQEQCALIEANLQQYWNEAYAASLLCDIFVPSDWRLKADKVPNHYEVINYGKLSIDGAEGYSLNSLYVPDIIKTNEVDYIVTWKDVAPEQEVLQNFTYDELSDSWKSEVNIMLECSAVDIKNNLYFTKIAEEKSFYTPKTPVLTWSAFLNSAAKTSINGFRGWNGVAINYMTAHFYDAGLSTYELLMQQRDDVWRKLFQEYPFLFLETSYTNDSATNSRDLLTLAKYAFEDQKYPEKSYSISLLDLVQALETLDNEDGTYNAKYFREAELHIGDGISISAEDYASDRDDVYEALSQYLFISDISRDLRNDASCQLTVNTIKYQDKLIRRLATMIRKNPLH